MNNKAYNQFIKTIEPSDGFMACERHGDHLIFTDHQDSKLGYWDKALDKGFIEKKRRGYASKGDNTVGSSEASRRGRDS